MHEIYRGVSRTGCIPAYPSCGYFNRGLYETITSSHLELHTKPGRIKGYKLMGVTYQVETTGNQLFDASLIPTTSSGGATVTNNGDGSFTVSGNGTLTSGFGHAIYLEDKDVRRLFRPGEIYMTESPTKTRPYFEVGFFKNNQNVFGLRQTSPFLKATLPDDFFSPENNLRVRYIFYGAPGLDIMPGTIKPMMYQDGDGTWEPYSESFPSPSPEYPQEIHGVGTKTGNLLDEKRMLDFILQKRGAELINFDGRRCLKLDVRFNLPDFNLYEGFETGKQYTISYEGYYASYEEPAGSSNGFTLGYTDGTALNALINYADIGKWKKVNQTTAPDKTVDKMCFFYGAKGVVYIDLDTLQLNEGTTALPYEPYGYKTTTWSKSKNLADISNVTPKAGIGEYVKVPGGFILDATDNDHGVSWIPCILKSGHTYAFRFRCTYNLSGYGVSVFLPEIYEYLTIDNRDGNIISGTFTPSKDVTLFSIYFGTNSLGTGVTAEITELQIQEGDTPTEYQPYGYSEANIYTQSPIYEGDKIEMVDGQYCHVRNNMITYGADIDWAEQFSDVTVFEDSYYSHAYASGVLIANEYGDVLSTHFERKDNIKTTNVNGTFLHNGLLRVRLIGVTTLDEFKAWMTEHNPQFLLPRAKPLIEPLPAVSQAAIRNLKTYKGTTIIDTIDPLEPEITVSYRPQADYSKIPGLEVDYEHGIYTRLGGAKNLTAGAQFNRFPMYAGRRRCNVSDDGTITAYVGDPNYREDGSNGQVMVYQPKFWYQVVPLKIEPQKDGLGYHLRRAQYWVSHKPMPGFKLHPAFLKPQELEYIMYSAYGGSIYDTSEAAYILDDAQVMDTATDKFSSIAGAKPASGKTQLLTRQNVEQLAQNRGPGWHGDTIKAESANQLLMMIELGTPNTQAAIGSGVVSIPDTPNTDNNSIITGGTSSLGNNTGMADGTNGKVSVTYRGMENPWGNVYKSVNGININGNGSQKGGIPYICVDYAFAESKNNGNYVSSGFTLSNESGFISAMGYSDECDWIFAPSETLGNSSAPVGDYAYIAANLNGYRIVQLGGGWTTGGCAGAFFCHMSYGVGNCYRHIGGRLIYVPQ